MKVAWAELKNQNKFSITDKRKQKLALRLPQSWHAIKIKQQQKDSRMPNRMSKLFWKWLVCLLSTSAVTSDFNQPRKEYINCISSDLSAEMISTQNDGQNSGWSRGLRSWIKLVPIQIHISPVNTPRKADCLMNWRFSATLVFLAFIWERVFTCIYSYSRAETTLIDGKLGKVTLEVTLGWKHISHEKHLVFFG